jgi:hypothetical protein
MNRQVLIIATIIQLVLCWSGSGFELQAEQNVLDTDAILERLKQLGFYPDTTDG